MSEELYEVLSLGMRYWFMLLGLMIVWRAFRWLRKDRREKHRRLRQLPDAGMIGELVVIVGSDELPEGTAIPVPREGVLGFLRTCDIVVPVPGVASHHIDFFFRNGKGLLLRPWRGCVCQVDADELSHRTKPSRYPMQHGSRLFVGDAVLRLRVFAGLDVLRYVEYAEEETEEALDENIQQPQWDNHTPPEPWQNTPYVYHQHAPAWQDSGRYDPLPWQQEDDRWITSGYPQLPQHSAQPYAGGEAEQEYRPEPETFTEAEPYVTEVRRTRRQRRYEDEP